MENHIPCRGCCQSYTGVLDFVVEILSPGTKARDQGYKKRFYARYGVSEYWIVDPKAKSLEVFIPKEYGFQLAGQYISDDYLNSNLFPELKLQFRELFRRDWLRWKMVNDITLNPCLPLHNGGGMGMPPYFYGAGRSRLEDAYLCP